MPPIEISVYPNPFHSSITIELVCLEEEDYILLLADVRNSKIIRMLGAGLSKGLNTIPLEDLSTLESGSYQLDIKNSDGELIYKTQLIKH